MHRWMPILVFCWKPVNLVSKLHGSNLQLSAGQKPLKNTHANYPPPLHSPLQDRAYEIVEDLEANKVRKMKKRICLVLDCLCAHDFSDKTADLINLQHYVIKEKRLSEREAIVIFYDVVRVVEALHKVSTHCG